MSDVKHVPVLGIHYLRAERKRREEGAEGQRQRIGSVCSNNVDPMLINLFRLTYLVVVSLATRVINPEGQCPSQPSKPCG